MLDFGVFKILRTILEINLNLNNSNEEVYMQMYRNVSLITLSKNKR